MVADPPNGKVPLKPEAVEARMATFAQPSDSLERYGPWERCITRGVPASMMPSAYNNGHQIVQTPDYVVFHSEMIHEARVNTLRYEATIDDPNVYTRPWSVAFPLNRDERYRIYEYACHEGNHALEKMLRMGGGQSQRR
jgi:hypothetical protein